MFRVLLGCVSFYSVLLFEPLSEFCSCTRTNGHGLHIYFFHEIFSDHPLSAEKYAYARGSTVWSIMWAIRPGYMKSDCRHSSISCIFVRCTYLHLIIIITGINLGVCIAQMRSGTFLRSTYLMKMRSYIGVEYNEARMRNAMLN